MARIDNFLFGYRRIRVEPHRLPLVTSCLLQKGIPTGVRGDGRFTVRERDIEATRAILEGYEYEESELLGLAGRYKRMKHKPAILAALVLSALLMLVSVNTVWDIRIEGNEALPDAVVVEELSRCGFNVGDLWLLKDRSAIESALLSSSEDVAWININRRGSVAYVKIAEKAQNGDTDTESTLGYSNVVASADCVIEEITVYSGQAVVKAGDAVKKGDLLIAGILPPESGGGFCHASGSITGRMSDTVTVTVPREYQTKTKTGEKLLTFSVKFFKINANIFKRYGNLPEECDIIEEISTFSLFGKCRLPIETRAIYSAEYVYETASYTDTELIRVAAARLNSATMSRLSMATLIRIRTYGEFTEDGYEMSNDITFTAEVGNDAPFTAE